MVDLDLVLTISEDIVARNIEGEILLIPLVAGIADLEDEFYTLNETGRTIFEKIDGKKTLREIKMEIAKEYGVPQNKIEKEIFGFVRELRKRKILINAQ